MPNRNYTRGRRLEYAVQEELERDGYITIRASGSHGVFDVIGLKLSGEINVKFVQLKLLKKFTKNALNLDREKIKKISSNLTGDSPIKLELWVRAERKWHKFRYVSGEEITIKLKINENFGMSKLK